MWSDHGNSKPALIYKNRQYSFSDLADMVIELEIYILRLGFYELRGLVLSSRLRKLAIHCGPSLIVR